ncbi:glycine zipper 2TM domain-containing protein [Sedimentitalea todarodis]|uniref:17 kDa surface antigen n=1 Tax=Sedimentitalea todarodis TaxID=1631240 RepID=A0ABU3VL06_9RHOB|nr:glycine zipper 2TM domain-containing protein [Sedimentitalea todarodis]MDU9006858.1 glycine zipper 2TM domain-containing protein [Sedimentitalea todarodis]
MERMANPRSSLVIVAVTTVALTFTSAPPVHADVLKGAVVGAGVGALIGGKKGARNGAIVGAVAGGVKRSKKKKR